MTITETRPEPEVVHEAPPPPAPRETWLTTADHKRVGLVYVFFSLLFLLVGGAIGIALKAELADSGVQLVDGNFSRLFSEHATVSTFLFLAPAWVGLASFLVPLQIGAARLAFPRVMAFSLWLYVFGGGTVLAAYVIGPPQGERAGALGFSNALPMRSPHGDTPTELWVMGLAVVALAAVLAAATLAVTILKLRTPGLTLRRLPMFSTATLVTSLGVLLATPVFLGGLILLFVDVHYGGFLFNPKTPGATEVWQHTLWLFGRPEVWLLALPGLGAAADIVATHARRRLLDDRPLQAALALFGILSFGVWWLPHGAAKALVLPNPPALNAVMGAIAGLVVLVLLGTVAKGRLRPHTSVLFVAGFVVLGAFGAANGIIAALADVHGRAWTEGHLHVVVFGAPTLLLVGALYHWAPKLFGRSLSAGVGGAVFLLLFGGFALMGLGDYLLGYNGAPAHVKDFPKGEDWTTYSQLGTVGAVLLGLGALVLLIELVRAAVGSGRPAGDDPYEGLTLEWATSSPPPPHNFDAVPEVRSAYPLLDLRDAQP